MWCLATADGSPIWSFAPGSGLFRATPAVDAEGNVYAGTKDNAASVFYAIKADGSGLLWSNPVGADLYSSPALGDDGAIYFASEFAAGARLHALDRATGQALWKSELPADSTWSSPAIDDDGTLYVATMAFGSGAPGAVVAFDTDSTGLLAGAGSPRFHGGNASTGRR
jgi:outer membrane protein assembly factor BamB